MNKRVFSRRLSSDRTAGVPRRSRTNRTGPRGNTRPTLRQQMAMPVEQRHRADPTTVRRAMLLGLLVAAMLVVITPTLRAYLQQRSEISQLRKQTVVGAQEVERLTAQKKQWLDPNYVKAQAGQKLGYAMPGQSVTVYIDNANKPHAVNSGTGVANATSLANRPWYGQMWESVVQTNNSK